ncbi:MAG: hypothetical protein ACYS4W_06770 [Planctomycetota bacterium]|jgi:hypothetical protein
MTKIENQHSDWLMIVPVSNLSVTDSPPINGKCQVDQVTFYSPLALDEFLHALPLSNQLTPLKTSYILFQRDGLQANAFAVTPQCGTPTDLRRQCFFEVRQACHVLASTLPFYGRRSQNFGFNLHGYPMHSAKYDSFLDLKSAQYCGQWGKRGLLQPFDLDQQWYNYIGRIKINQLFDRIQDTNLDHHWRRQISSAAAMLGKSFISLELADAFLLDVIGLETLLTRPRERNGKKLAQRIKGLTGWHLKNENPSYESEIQEIHEIRCAIVHDSDYGRLTVEHLLRADIYLMNALLNIVVNPNLFPDKNTMIGIVDAWAQKEDWQQQVKPPNQLHWAGKKPSQRDLDLPLW